jgi:clan AA aspartic protease (TIGR02281 family)
MLNWALRVVVLWCGIAIGISYVWSHRATLFPAYHTSPRQVAVVTAPAEPSAEPSPPPRPVFDVPGDSVVVQADSMGQFEVNASVNGAAVRFVVDTGATFVALTMGDARAAGIDTDRLRFTGHAQTANGIVALAPIMLEDVRIDDVTVHNVLGTVSRDGLRQSLLGMSFLNRLRSYQISGGRLTINP